jgi:hypothetical protein
LARCSKAHSEGTGDRGASPISRYVPLSLAGVRLFVLNESVILGQRQMSFAPQGFALINAAVMTKVMLIAEDPSSAGGSTACR